LGLSGRFSSLQRCSHRLLLMPSEMAHASVSLSVCLTSPSSAPLWGTKSLRESFSAEGRGMLGSWLPRSLRNFGGSSTIDDSPSALLPAENIVCLRVCEAGDPLFVCFYLIQARYTHLSVLETATTHAMLTPTSRSCPFP